jgi:hypothetical protein
MAIYGSFNYRDCGFPAVIQVTYYTLFPTNVTQPISEVFKKEQISSPGVYHYLFAQLTAYHFNQTNRAADYQSFIRFLK